MDLKFSIDRNRYNYGIGVLPYSTFIKVGLSEPPKDFFQAFDIISKYPSKDIIFYGDMSGQIKDLEVLFCYLISQGFHVSFVTTPKRLVPQLILNRWILYADCKLLQSNIKSGYKLSIISL
jgi:hypothetical protein